MPTYEYECDNCHFQFERKQKFDEEPIAMCPKCQGRTHRTIHSISVIFKGSGFYTTDYRSPSSTEQVKETMRNIEAEQRKAGGKAEKKAEGKRG